MVIKTLCWIYTCYISFSEILVDEIEYFNIESVVPLSNKLFILMGNAVLLLTCYLVLAN